MKISELVERLEDAKKEYGNIDTVVRGKTIEETYPVCGWSIVFKGDNALLQIAGHKPIKIN